MPRAMPPTQRVQVEKMRYGDCLDLRPQLRLPFEQQIIIAHWVVLHIIVGMRRKRRAIGVHRVRVARTRPVFSVTAGDVTVGDPSPFPGSKIEGVHV